MTELERWQDYDERLDYTTELLDAPPADEALIEETQDE